MATPRLHSGPTEPTPHKSRFTDKQSALNYLRRTRGRTEDQIDVLLMSAGLGLSIARVAKASSSIQRLMESRRSNAPAATGDAPPHSELDFLRSLPPATPLVLASLAEPVANLADAVIALHDLREAMRRVQRFLRSSAEAKSVLRGAKRERQFVAAFTLIAGDALGLAPELNAEEIHAVAHVVGAVGERSSRRAPENVSRVWRDMKRKAETNLVPLLQHLGTHTNSAFISRMTSAAPDGGKAATEDS